MGSDRLIVGPSLRIPTPRTPTAVRTVVPKHGGIDNALLEVGSWDS
jgi:hypothetical protein